MAPPPSSGEGRENGTPRQVPGRGQGREADRESLVHTWSRTDPATSRVCYAAAPTSGAETWRLPEPEALAPSSRPLVAEPGFQPKPARPPPPNCAGVGELVASPWRWTSEGHRDGRGSEWGRRRSPDGGQGDSSLGSLGRGSGFRGHQPPCAGASKGQVQGHPGSPCRAADDQGISVMTGLPSSPLVTARGH